MPAIPWRGRRVAAGIALVGWLVTAALAPAAEAAITGVPTSITAFLGRAGDGPVGVPAEADSYAQFEAVFGGLQVDAPMTYSVRDFFANGGSRAVIVRLRAGDTDGPLSLEDLLGNRAAHTGLYALDRADLFNLLCIPPDARGGDVPPAVLQAALAYCVERRAVLLVDPPAGWAAAPDPVAAAVQGLAGLGLSGDARRNAAIYFPPILEADPLLPGAPLPFGPSGAVAGVIARTDEALGVWEPPAGSSAGIHGIAGLEAGLTPEASFTLVAAGINPLRSFAGIGPVVWGARTLAGGAAANDEYKYIPVRRLALHIEESVSRGIVWAASEANGEPLWQQLRLDVGAFMHDLYVQGAFKGSTPSQAYFARCDATTTTQHDADCGLVSILIGFAPLTPAEFLLSLLRQPVATSGLSCAASASPASGGAPLAVRFDTTWTPAGCPGAASALWSFGDGASSSEASPTHVYTVSRSCDWTLTATLNGATCTASGIVNVSRTVRRRLGEGRAEARPPGGPP